MDIHHDLACIAETARELQRLAEALANVYQVQLADEIREYAARISESAARIKQSANAHVAQRVVEADQAAINVLNAAIAGTQLSRSVPVIGEKHVE